MKMIVGLGNPGRKYLQTKHNVGFMTVDRFAAAHQVKFDQHQFEAAYGTYFENGEKVFVVKPQTFMNDSGRAVKPLMTYYQIQLDELVIVYDDMDLTPGSLRLRERGSAGGHNGIKSLISFLKTQDFNRVRIGTGHPTQQSVVSWVLSPFDQNARPLVDQTIDSAVCALDDWVQGADFMQVMNHYNRKG